MFTVILRIFVLIFGFSRLSYRNQWLRLKEFYRKRELTMQYAPEIYFD